MLTTNYVPGAPVWLDLGTPDVDASAPFYGALFGWEFQSTGPEGGGYGMFTLGGKTVAAAGPLTEEGASPAWTLYFHTFDADTTAKAVSRPTVPSASGRSTSSTRAGWLASATPRARSSPSGSQVRPRAWTPSRPEHAVLE